LAPRDVALKIVAAIPTDNNSLIDRLEVAGPGFVNIWLRTDFVQAELNTLLDKVSVLKSVAAIPAHSTSVIDRLEVAIRTVPPVQDVFFFLFPLILLLNDVRKHNTLCAELFTCTGIQFSNVGISMRPDQCCDSGSGIRCFFTPMLSL
jgi:hypothetical protein